MVERTEGRTPVTGTLRVKTGLAEMLKGGVIMDVVNAEQAKIAEQSGATSVMAKVRIGHLYEARLLEAMAVDFIDESEVLTPADEAHHVDKFAFSIPFVCGARDLGEALRRIGEGAALIRTKGEAGSGNIVEAVRHMRAVTGAIRRLTVLGDEELMHEAKTLGAPYELVRWVAKEGRLPVPNFAAGGIATPADAALMMTLGAEAVFVGSGIFKSKDPERRARAVVEATTHYRDPGRVLAASRGLGEAMPGIDVAKLEERELLQTRGW